MQSNFHGQVIENKEVNLIEELQNPDAVRESVISECFRVE
jgi:hypothetical protein